MAEASSGLTYRVITSADDGQDHLVCERAALRVFRERGRGGFPATCGYLVRPETDVQKMGVTRCQLCDRRLPPDAVVRAEPRHSELAELIQPYPSGHAEQRRMVVGQSNHGIVVGDSRDGWSIDS